MQIPTQHLSHDMPCQCCGHALHVYLSCGDGCDCPPTLLPGTQGTLGTLSTLSTAGTLAA